MTCLLLIICVAGVLKCAKDRFMRGAGDMLAHFRALVIMVLCDSPPPPIDPVDRVEIIPICFNASDYAGWWNTSPCWLFLIYILKMKCFRRFEFKDIKIFMTFTKLFLT